MKQRHKVTQIWPIPMLHYGYPQVNSSHGVCNDRENVSCPFLQFRSELCVSRRMEVMKKAILERDFKTFAETTMKVNLHAYRPPYLLLQNRRHLPSPSKFGDYRPLNLGNLQNVLLRLKQSL